MVSGFLPTFSLGRRVGAKKIKVKCAFGEKDRKKVTSRRAMHEVIIMLVKRTSASDGRCNGHAHMLVCFDSS